MNTTSLRAVVGSTGFGFCFERRFIPLAVCRKVQVTEATGVPLVESWRRQLALAEDVAVTSAADVVELPTLSDGHRDGDTIETTVRTQRTGRPLPAWCRLEAAVQSCLLGTNLGEHEGHLARDTSLIDPWPEVGVIPTGGVVESDPLVSQLAPGEPAPTHFSTL